MSSAGGAALMGFGAVPGAVAGATGPVMHEQQHQVVPSAQGSTAGPAQVSLSLLIEFIVQRTYHDLTVLAELLPRKTDMERKVEIFNFAAKTRMLLVRLLALVKWASSASKVDKCVGIMNFCERSAQIFMDSADSMARMARETLVRATLPNFHLPAAVEILTTGSYSRVPRCIRDRIVPPEPITPSERQAVLLKLNQVIEHRLVTSEEGVPLRMRNLKIENGMVTFFVENEFEVTLTLMGDGPQIPWRLLKVKILVEDRETGEGKSLIHSMQVHYVEQLIQSRISDNQRPLHEVYHTLHFLCQAMQLEVLHAQTQKLCFERLGEYVRIEEYKPGRCLTLSYWRELMTRDPHSEVGYRFSVQVDPNDPAKPLMVCHVPPLNPEDAELTERAIQSEHISMERLLVHSIYVRTKARLSELKREVQRRLSLGDVEASLHGSPAVLSIPILQPCLRSEQLLVTVDTHTGMFLAHVPHHEGNPFTADIQRALNRGEKSNNAPGSLEALVSQLRFWITQQRVRKTLQQLPATPYERLPLAYDESHPLTKLSRNKMFIKLHHQRDAILIVEFKEKAANHCEMEYDYYLLWVSTDPSVAQPPSSIDASSKVSLKALSLIEFDSFLLTHGPGTKVDVQELSERIIGKRKLGGKVEVPFKRTKFPAYFISDLAHVVSFTAERIPFTGLAGELSKRSIAHSGAEVESEGVGLCIKLLHLPTAMDNSSKLKKETLRKLQNFLLSASIRMIQKEGRSWKLELAFKGNPITRLANRNGATSRQCLHFTYDVLPYEHASKSVDAIVAQCTEILQLFDLACELEAHVEASEAASSVVAVRSYGFTDLTLEYGPGASQTARVQWSSEEACFKLSFCGSQEVSSDSPHTLIQKQLEQHLNEHRNLALTAKLLQETYGPLRSLSRLPQVPLVSIAIYPQRSTKSMSRASGLQAQQQLQNRALLPVETFVPIPQSPTHLKLLFYNTYCLDIQIKAGGLVYIRDGAFSLFDQRKSLDEIQPIRGIKSFLMKYVDESALQRRQSQTAEDDNPPSPMQVGGAAGSGDGDAGLKFHSSQTPPSNPLTPVSPLNSAGSANPPGGQNFLQSPPSIRNPSPAMPSPGGLQPTPSPSGFTAPSPANPVGSVGSPFPGTAQSPMAMGSPGHPRPSPRPGLSPHPSPAGGPESVLSQAERASHMSRILPQRLWAGANPTPLTAQAFDDLCKPSIISPPGPGIAVPSNNLAPLHWFLGCLYLRRLLQHYIKDNESFQEFPTPDPATIAFKMDNGLIGRITSFASNYYQSLHLKLEPPDPMMTGGTQLWSAEMVKLLERFFDTKVAVPPFRPNALISFMRILLVPIEPLKDVVNLVRFELDPDLIVKGNFKWSCKLCLTTASPAKHILPPGQPSILKLNEKMLILLKFQRANVQLPSGLEPLTVYIPLIYDLTTNLTQVAQKEMTPLSTLAKQRLDHLGRSGQLNLQRCTIFPSIQDLMYNLPDGPPQQGPALGMMPQQQPGYAGGPGGPPVGPGMMMAGLRPMNPGMMMRLQQRMGAPVPQRPQGGNKQDNSPRTSHTY